MRHFNRLDEMLAVADPGDAWGDDGVLLAADTLRAFMPDDWAQLSARWADRPEVWQCLAADALADADERYAIPLLLDMIGRGAPRARVGACDTLRVLLQGRAEPLDVAPAVTAVLAALERESTGLVGWSAAELRRRVR